MAIALAVSNPIQPHEVYQYISSMVEANSKKWKVNLRTLDEGTKEDILAVVLKTTSSKLQATKSIRWNPEAQDVYILLDNEFLAANDIDAADFVDSHDDVLVQLGASGARLYTPDAQDVTEAQSLADMSELIERLIQTYLADAAFITVGAVKVTCNK